MKSRDPQLAEIISYLAAKDEGSLLIELEAITQDRRKAKSRYRRSIAEDERARADKQCRESCDRISYLRSELRQVRHAHRGINDFELIQAMDFVNSDLACGSELHRAQTIIRACIQDLMKYGKRLYAIEKSHRPKDNEERAHPPLDVEKLMRIRAVQELNQSFSSPGIRAVCEALSQRTVKIGVIATSPPAFFGYSVLDSQPGQFAGRLLSFLRICARVDPRRWCKCRKCHEFFARTRARDTTLYCSRKCKDDSHNSRPKRKQSKSKQAARYLKLGDRYRG
jgi:hypothetical protein